MFFLAAVMAIVLLAYYLLILYVVVPRVLKKFAKGDPRREMWIAKDVKIRQQRLIMIYAIGLAFCLLALGWAIIQVKVLKIPY